MLFTESIKNTITEHCKGKEHVKMTVGIIKGDEKEVKLFGPDGEEPFHKYSYEIGSITKTFTGSLLAKAVEEKKVNMYDPITKYLEELDDSKYYPTLAKLVTHSSGCPVDPPEYDGPAYKKTNPFKEIDSEHLIDELKKLELEDKEYPVEYSNFGCSVVGYILEKVYNKSYETLMKEFLSDMGLTETYTLNPLRDLDGYNEDNENCGHWDWESYSAYTPAGYLYSNVHDMLSYAKVYIEQQHSWTPLSYETYGVVGGSEPRQEIGMFWMKLPDYHVICHNGGTGSFNTMLCIDLKNKNAVVGLSNYHDETNMSFIVSILVSLSKQ